MTEHPVIDPGALGMLERVGKRALVERMVGMFLINGPSRLDTASAAVGHGDRDGVERAAHSLRSSAGQIGALQLQECCARLEAGARGGASFGELERLTNLAEEALTAAVSALASVIKSSDTPG